MTDTQNKQELTLPSGTTAVIKEWAEAWVSMDVADKPDKQKFFIESLVLSINGCERSEVYAKFRELPMKDFRVLDKAITALLLPPDELPN